jgi:hypothetical protein
MKEIQGMSTPTRKGFLSMDFEKRFKDASKYIKEIQTMSMPERKGILPKNFDSKFTDVGSQFIQPAIKKYDELQSKIDMAGMSFKQLPNLFKGIGSSAKAEFKNVDDMLKKVGTTSKKSKVPFAGWAMSIMFFGMALKRIFDSIWKTSTKTFNDVMHSVEGTTTGFDLLQGSLTYLGFTLGMALEPIAEFIVPIIDYVSEWVLENQKLAAGIVITAGVLGTMFLFLGSMKLALDGFKALAAIMNLIKLNSSGAVSGMGPLLTKLSAFLATPVGVGVAAVLALLIALGAIVWTSFLKTPEAWKTVKDTFLKLKEPLKGLGEALENLILVLLPSFEDGWTAIAWTSAWVFDMIVNAIGIVIDSVSALVNMLALGIETIKLWWNTITNPMAAFDNLEKVKKLQQDIDDRMQSIAQQGIAIGSVMMEGPSGYRKRKEAEIAEKEMRETRNRLGEEFMTSQEGRTYTNHIENLFLTSDRDSILFDQIEDNI